MFRAFRYAYTPRGVLGPRYANLVAYVLQNQQSYVILFFWTRKAQNLLLKRYVDYFPTLFEFSWWRAREQFPRQFAKPDISAEVENRGSELLLERRAKGEILATSLTRPAHTLGACAAGSP